MFDYFSGIEINDYISASYFKRVQEISETFIHSSVCILGVLLNIGAIVIWYKDKLVDKKLRWMSISVILADQIYLVSLVSFMLARPRGDNLLFYNGSLEIQHYFDVSSKLNCTEELANISSVYVESCNITINTTNTTLTYDQQVDLLKMYYCQISGKYHFVHYLSVWVGTFQCFSNWMLYMCASEGNKIIRNIVFNHKRTTNKFWPMFVFICIALYFSVYVPELRSLINENVFRKNVHNYLLMPFLNHWEFVLNETCGSDLFYILFFSLTYSMNTHVLPYVMIVSIVKSTFDALHESQRVKMTDNLNFMSSCRAYEKSSDAAIPLKTFNERYVRQKCKKGKVGVISDNQRIRESVLYPSLVISITCTVYLICVALKMIILMFKSFEFVMRYLANAQIFFGYLNVYANFIQILKATVHLPVVVLFNKKYQVRVMRELEPFKRLIRCNNDDDDDDDGN
ncbi:hypothetical protein HELRODRAFT_174607 [Helobdella robusta]|uniref:Uncharacterized protein n=1 Tax=Helobdella robusta TaxID=6412 RepID=T1F8A7_HELRO|nr:hypothetical protein HELRODRAFT_174607 [Helobdella robusta]ESO01648.1 hypothetical protein HELRODRAFT_174607 [Helobdella robusta]